MACCFFWGANFVVSAWAIADHGAQPFLLAAVRALFVLVFMAPFLFKTRPKHFWRLMAVCICVGPIHLGFLYTGLTSAPASASSIVAQMMIPFATVLSVIFLKERVGWVRSLGIAGALIGVIVMIYDPETIGFNTHLLYIIGAYIFLAIGSIIMKTVGNVDWKQYVAWMAVATLLAMTAGSLAFETGQVDTFKASAFPLLSAALYAAIGVSIIAHGQYFRLIQNYDVSVIVPLTLMTPVFGTILGIGLRGEAFSASLIIGAALILPSVYIIARRSKIAPIQED